MFVKICGITSESDALAAVAMGADAVGFMFVPRSKRVISPEAAGDIAKRLPSDILTVGVFADEAPERVVEIVNGQGLSAAQLHGNESIEDTAYVSARVPRTMKAFVAGSEEHRRADAWGTDPVLIDAPSGGSGTGYDYRLAHLTPMGLHLMLAGGLRPENVADAIRIARPWAVDVSTGVETEPGKKSAQLMAEFIRNARSVDVGSLPQPSM